MRSLGRFLGRIRGEFLSGLRGGTADSTPVHHRETTDESVENRETPQGQRVIARRTTTVVEEVQIVDEERR